jgi:hypothetical protein
MQKWIYLFLVIFISANTAFTQVVEKKRTMSLGTQNALIVSLPNADNKLIEKMWKSYIGEHGTVKRNRKTKEYYADDIRIPSVSGAASMDVYAWGEDGQLVVFFDMGDAFLSSETHSKTYENAELYLIEFGYDVKRYQIGEELEDEERALKNLERDLDRLGKLNDGYHDDIERAKQRIAEAETDIEQNLIDQENKKEEINNQEGVIEETQKRLEDVGKK